MIRNTASISQDIAESIRSENDQFTSINAMAESNAKDTAELAAQAGRINEMVDEMASLFSHDE